MRVIWSASRDAHHNLAWESWALDHFDSEGPLLLFYVNDPAIVLGKNQNPWREAATGWARREGVPFARRVSGGGAVWHDDGNLNFSLVTARAGYKQDAVFARTIDALRDLGVSATVQHGNSLVVEGRKISGTAFCFRGAAALHHGTMLIQSDLARLRRALMPALPEIETRAISSRPAPVANLTEFAPGLTVERGAASLARHLAPKGVSPLFLTAVKNKGLTPFQEEGWVWGHTPAFEWRIAADGPRVCCERGRVTRIVLPDGREIAGLSIPFERAALANALGAYAEEWSRAALARDW